MVEFLTPRRLPDRTEPPYLNLSADSLLLTVAKNAIFTRDSRSLFTIYCDEFPNLIGQSNDIETVLSEARKFGVSVVAANQFLDQYPAAMRAAVLSLGTHVFFQLSSADVIADVRKELMGHSKGGDVHSLYTHVELPTLRDAIARLEAWHRRN